MNATSPDLRTAQWVVTTEASPWQTRDDLVLGSPTGMPDVFVKPSRGSHPHVGRARRDPVSGSACRHHTSVELVETR